MCSPGLGAGEGKGATGWVELSTRLHTAGVTAMVGFSQAKAAKDLAPSCERKTKPQNMTCGSAYAVKTLDLFGLSCDFIWLGTTSGMAKSY